MGYIDKYLEHYLTYLFNELRSNYINQTKRNKADTCLFSHKKAFFKGNR